MNDDRLVIVCHFEVDPHITGSIAIERFPISQNLAKGRFGTQLVYPVEIFRTDLKFVQNRQLLQRGKLGNLGGANFVEYDLEHIVSFPRRSGRDNEKVRSIVPGDPESRALQLSSLIGIQLRLSTNTLSIPAAVAASIPA